MEVDSSCYCKKYVVDTSFICSAPEIRTACIEYYINSWDERTKIRHVKKIIGNFNYDSKNKSKYIKDRFNVEADRYIEYLRVAFCNSDNEIVFESGDFYRFFFFRRRLVEISKFSR